MIKYIDDKKVCSKCKELKPLTDFYRWAKGKDKYYPSCKICKNLLRENWRLAHPEKIKEQYKRMYAKHRLYIIKKTTEYQKKNPHIRRKSLLNFYYGLSLEAYQALTDKNNGKCWICNTVPNKLFVDHNHQTNKVRGILCTKCNSLLGFCNDNIEILKTAIQYLEKSKEGAYGLA